MNEEDKALLKKLLAEQPTCRHFMWGLWDYEDRCWYGTHAGPNVYAYYIKAAAAATLLNTMLDRWTIRVRIMFPNHFLIKDHIEARLTAEQALRLMHA